MKQLQTLSFGLWKYVKKINKFGYNQNWTSRIASFIQKINSVSSDRFLFIQVFHKKPNLNLNYSQCMTAIQDKLKI